ncbi:hypothetical protein VNO80_13225 [Phaseolus coccineus]|uniref:Uncharacterized protein n=1 Tax=Phaseolus coccineus TaxID=3886 RepID=A0AAN9N738_PHACN
MFLWINYCLAWKGYDKIEFIKLEGYNNIQVQWNGKAFKEMENLRILIIEDSIFPTGPEHLPNSLRVLHWSCYPSPSLPSDFNPKRLEILLMPESCLQIFKPQKACLSVKDCKFLTDLPSLRETPLLTTLRLDKCSNLVNIDESIGFLDKLRFLSAKGCTKLKTLAPCIMLTSLETLDLRSCKNLESYPEGCRMLDQLPGSISVMRKVNVLVGYGHGAYEIFEEELRSEVSPRAMVISGHDRYLDVCYAYISPNNAIQVCSPNPLMHSDFRLLFPELRRNEDNFCFRRESSIHFSFRNKFPKIVLCCSISLPFVKSFAVLNLKLRVFINDTMQFSAVCNFIERGWNAKLWCNLEGKVERVFSEQEWNKAEIVFELDFPMGRNLTNRNITSSIHRGSLNWNLICVYEEGNNKDDIEFKHPMSIFPLCNIQPPSSLPTSLYYVVSRGNPE